MNFLLDLWDFSDITLTFYVITFGSILKLCGLSWKHIWLQITESHLDWIKQMGFIAGIQGYFKISQAAALLAKHWSPHCSTHHFKHSPRSFSLDYFHLHSVYTGENDHGKFPSLEILSCNNFWNFIASEKCCQIVAGENLNVVNETQPSNDVESTWHTI